MKKQTKPATGITIINEGDERRDRRERDAEKAQYTSRRSLHMERLEKDGDREWAATTRAAMEVWLGWIAALSQDDDNGS